MVNEILRAGLSLISGGTYVVPGRKNAHLGSAGVFGKILIYLNNFDFGGTQPSSAAGPFPSCGIASQK